MAIGYLLLDIAGKSINTVTKLLVDLGTACAIYQNETLRDLPCKRLQLDEIWSFCYAKQKNVPPWRDGVLGHGDVWTWTAICADTKLVPSWLVGQRNAFYADKFVKRPCGTTCRASADHYGRPEAIHQADGKGFRF